MNHAVKASMWFIVLLFLIPIVAAVLGVWWSRLG
jgi:hypothetical protein